MLAKICADVAVFSYLSAISWPNIGLENITVLVVMVSQSKALSKCRSPAKPWLFFSFQYRNQQHLQQDQLGSTVNPKPCLSEEVLLSPGSIHSLPLTMHTSSASPVPYQNISPAKKIRNIKRLLSFQFKKMPEIALYFTTGCFFILST
jgi:hypothetical protein